MSDRTLIVHLHESDAPRGSRRIILHADLLKASKIAAGDAVLVTHANRAENYKVRLPLLRLWPDR